MGRAVARTFRKCLGIDLGNGVFLGLFGRVVVVMLASAALSGCYHWTAQPVTVLSAPDLPSQAKVTTLDGEELHLRELYVEGDTMLVGVADGSRQEIAIQSVVGLELYRYSVLRTTVGTVLFAFIAYSIHAMNNFASFPAS